MTFFHALILGLVQGITEFFPISSSGHLRLFKWFLGIPDGEHLLFFDLVCHAGTLLALLIYLRKDVIDILTDRKKIALYGLALIPLVPAYFLLKPLRLVLSDPSYLGYCLMITGAILYTASLKTVINPRLQLVAEGGKPVPHSQFERVPKWKDVLCIGVVQCLALIPGISRSGSTIAAARFCGWEWKEAARFSFLLSIPTILGGQLLETIKLLKGESEAVGAISWICYGSGFAAAFIVGLGAVRFVFWVYNQGSVRPFAAYCLGAGLFAWAVFNHG